MDGVVGVRAQVAALRGPDHGRVVDGGVVERLLLRGQQRLREIRALARPRCEAPLVRRVLLRRRRVRDGRRLRRARSARSKLDGRLRLERGGTEHALAQDGGKFGLLPVRNQRRRAHQPEALAERSAVVGRRDARSQRVWVAPLHPRQVAVGEAALVRRQRECADARGHDRRACGHT
jgi:hypothetical protein